MLSRPAQQDWLDCVDARAEMGHGTYLGVLPHAGQCLKLRRLVVLVGWNGEVLDLTITQFVA